MMKSILANITKGEKTMITKIGCAGLTITLCLLLFSTDIIAGEKKEKRFNEVREVKKRTGRLDSLRPEKIVLTYEPEGQENAWMQTYYLRDENTKFLNKGEEELEPGDIVEITYIESRWLTKEEKKRAERIAASVSFVRSRATEEALKKNKPKRFGEGKISSSNVQHEHE